METAKSRWILSHSKCTQECLLNSFGISFKNSDQQCVSLKNNKFRTWFYQLSNYTLFVLFSFFFVNWFKYGGPLMCRFCVGDNLPVKMLEMKGLSHGNRGILGTHSQSLPPDQ